MADKVADMTRQTGRHGGTHSERSGQSRWWRLGTACAWVVCVCALGCKSDGNKVEKAPAAVTATGPADLLVDGTGAGARRLEDAQSAQGEALEAFLGATAAPLLRCGATAAARARYRPQAGTDSPLVVLLVAFPDADAARCAMDVDRPNAVTLLKPGADLDERPLATALGPRTVLAGARGSHFFRVFPPLDGTGLVWARKLAVAQYNVLPVGAAPLLAPLLPSAYREPDTVRVVAQGPLAAFAGRMASARYSCGDESAVQAFVGLCDDAETAASLRSDHQVTAAAAGQTVSGFSLGSVQGLSVVDGSRRETIVLQNGRMLWVVTGIQRRSECAPALESMAAVKPPLVAGQAAPPPDAGAPARRSEDGGASP